MIVPASNHTLSPRYPPLLPARRVPSSLVAAAPLRSSDPCAGGHSRTAARAGRNGSSTSPTHILPFLALPSGSRTPPCSRGPSPAARPGARGAASAPRRRLLPRAAGGLQPSAAARADPRARQGRPLRPLLQPPRRPGARAVSFVFPAASGLQSSPAALPLLGPFLGVTRCFRVVAG